MKLMQYKIDQANALARALYTILKTASTEEYYGKTLEDILLDKGLNIAKTSNLYRVCNFLTSRLQHVRRLPSNQVLEVIVKDFYFYTAQMLVHKITNPENHPEMKWFIQVSYRLTNEEYNEFIGIVKSRIGILSIAHELQATYLNRNNLINKGIPIFDTTGIIENYLVDPYSMQHPGYSVIRNSITTGINVFMPSIGKDIGKVNFIYRKEGKIYANMYRDNDIGIVGHVLVPRYLFSSGKSNDLFSSFTTIYAFDCVKVID